MKNFLKGRRVKSLLGIMLLVCGIGILTLVLGKDGNILSSALGFVTTPVQKVTSEAYESIAGLFPSTKSSEEYEKKIQRLEEEVQRLRAVTADYYNIKKENIQYEKYYELKKNHDSLKFAKASVIGRSPDEIFYSFSIDQGTLAGISIGDAVITPKGFVGWISSVGAMSAKVTTILSPDSKVGCFCTETGDSGVAEGNPKLADRNLTRMKYLSSKATLSPESMIVTSGTGGVYPKDLPVGKVISIENESDGSRYAQIQPYEDIPNVTDVFVVLDFRGKGDIA